MDKKVVELDLRIVLPNRFQPRIKFNEDSIVELAESIKEHGVISPIIVRPINDKYEIIAGERRYKASVMAGKTTIPAIITDLDDKDSIEVALIENVQRQDLTPIEEAVSYKKILDMGYLKQDDLANKLGKSQSTIANKLRLLNLDDNVQEALLDQKISERHARSLLKLASFEQQNQALANIIKNRLTVRKTDELIETMLKQPEDLEIINIDERIEGKEMNNENANNLNIPNAPIVNDIIIEEPLIEPLTFNPIPQNDAVISQEATPVNNAPIIEQMPIFSAPIQEVVTPIIPEPVAAPGFMDVEKIQNEAQDIYIEKPAVDMNSLLGGTSTEVQQPIIEPIAEEIPQGKFFNILAEDNSVSDLSNEINNPFVTTPIQIEPTQQIEIPTPIAAVPTMMPEVTTVTENVFAQQPVQVDETPFVASPSYEAQPIMENSVVPPVIEPIVMPTIPVYEQPEVSTIIPEPVVPIINIEPAILETPISINPTPVYEQPVISTEIYNTVENTPMPVYEPVLNNIELNTQPTVIAEPVITSQPAPITNIMPAISKARECASLLENMGFKVEVEEIDLPGNYQVNIIIDK